MRSAGGPGAARRVVQRLCDRRVHDGPEPGDRAAGGRARRAARLPGQGALTTLLLVPLILPPFVGAIGLHHLLGALRHVQHVARPARGDRARDRLHRPRGLLGHRGHRGPAPVPDPVPERHGGAGQPRPGARGSGREPRRGPVPAVRRHRPAADPPGAVRRHHHRLHLVADGARHAADVRLRAGHPGADLQRHQGDGRVPGALRPDRRVTGRGGGKLRAGPPRLRRPAGADDRTGVDPGRVPTAALVRGAFGFLSSQTPQNGALKLAKRKRNDCSHPLVQKSLVPILPNGCGWDPDRDFDDTTPDAPLLPHYPQISIDEMIGGSPLVKKLDRNLVPDALFVAMAQLEPCRLTIADKTGSYRKLELGFVGFCCKHCGGQPGFGR